MVTERIFGGRQKFLLSIFGVTNWTFVVGGGTIYVPQRIHFYRNLDLKEQESAMQVLLYI